MAIESVLDVLDGKSRPLVRMFITKSSRYQAPRRRRRPKNAAAGSSLVATTSSSVAAAAAALCRVQDLKQEPSSEVCDSLHCYTLAHGN